MNIKREQMIAQRDWRNHINASCKTPQYNKPSGNFTGAQTAQRTRKTSSVVYQASRPSRPLIGIALGAGAARGWAHIGVLKALKKAGISPDVVAGTSIGAVAGGCYIANKLKALEAFATDLSLRRIFSYLDFNIRGGGLISGDRLHEALGDHLDHQPIETFSKRFVSIATELKSGKEVWLEKGPITQAVRASYALPGIFNPVCLEGQWLTDGALVNPIPVSACRALGAQYIIAVNLNSSETVDHRSEAKVRQRDQLKNTPGIKSVIYDAFNISMNSITNARMAADQPDLKIQPKLGTIGMFDFHRAKESIALGELAVKTALCEIKRNRDIFQPASSSSKMHAMTT